MKTSSSIIASTKLKAHNQIAKINNSWKKLQRKNEIVPRLGLDFGNVIKKDGELIPGVKEAIRELREAVFGDEVYIVSRVETDENAQKTRIFLETEGFYADGLINPCKVYFCYKRHEKAPIVRDLGITHFVDDRTEVLSYMKTVPCRFAFNPEEQQLHDFPPRDMVLVTNWEDVVSSVRLSCQA